MIKLDESFQSARLLFFFLFNWAFGDFDPLSLLPLWLLVLLPAAWQEFAWHASELYNDFSVCGVSACVCVCVSCVVRSLPLSMLFTGNTQTSHPIAQSPPRHPPHKGTCCDLSTLHDQLYVLFVGIVSWFEIAVLFGCEGLGLVISKQLTASCWITLWPTDRSWWLSFLLCAQRCLWVLLGTLAPRLERTGPWSVGSTGGRRKMFM